MISKVLVHDCINKNKKLLFNIISLTISIFTVCHITMCKSQTTYAKGSTSDSQTGILNIWFSSEGVPWVFVGAAAVLFLWCLLTSHSCMKKRKAHRNLQATNLALSNHRMGQSIISAPAQPEMPSIIAGMPPAYGMSQPFLPPSAPAPLANSSAVDPNYRVMSLTYNKPFTS